MVEARLRHRIAIEELQRQDWATTSVAQRPVAAPCRPADGEGEQVAIGSRDGGLITNGADAGQANRVGGDDECHRATDERDPQRNDTQKDDREHDQDHGVIGVTLIVERPPKHREREHDRQEPEQHVRAGCGAAG